MLEQEMPCWKHSQLLAAHNTQVLRAWRSCWTSSGLPSPATQSAGLRSGGGGLWPAGESGEAGSLAGCSSSSSLRMRATLSLSILTGLQEQLKLVRLAWMALTSRLTSFSASWGLCESRAMRALSESGWNSGLVSGLKSNWRLSKSVGGCSGRGGGFLLCFAAAVLTGADRVVRVSWDFLRVGEATGLEGRGFRESALCRSRSCCCRKCSSTDRLWDHWG
mmetsp:Transcript_16854/g.23205  ORF Transcript_16854/g.23205 Transcript_16854/m.23205 type:complete len:220 (-) Transcript_16854:463-1122(-)